MKYIILIITITIIFVTLNTKEECKTFKVVRIGGCDKDGFCGVQYSDNSYSRVYFPIEGQIIQKCESVWK